MMNQELSKQAQAFAQQSEETPSGIIREFWDFLRYSKKWWLTPVILVLAFVGLFVLLSATAAAPFLYPF